MIRIDSAAALLESFRPMDRRTVELPEGLRFPLLVTDYMTWLEPSGVRIHVVFADPRTRIPMGITFRRDTGGAVSPSMCEWCHSIRGDEGVGLLTAASSAHRRVGLHLCRDLACKERVVAAAEGGADFGGGSARGRVHRLVEQMASFARQSLF